MHGGEQEGKRRASTHNVPGIVGLAKAVELAERLMSEETKRITALRNKLIRGLFDRIDRVRLNGHPEMRLANNVNISIEYCEGEAMILSLDLMGIACSTGSACSSTSVEPSHVLRAIGLSVEETRGSLRFSLEDTRRIVRSIRSSRCPQKSSTPQGHVPCIQEHQCRKRRGGMNAATMKDKVVIAISGGVDSSVAALLLKEQGHEVVGITMCLGVAAEEGGRTKCCGPREIEDARRVCQMLEIPHYAMDFSGDLEEHIVRPFIDEYARGRTRIPALPAIATSNSGRFSTR